MRIIPLEIPDVVMFLPEIFRDNRGYFLEAFRENLFSFYTKNKKFVQDNISYSNKNVIRGLHYQIKTPQGKLVRVISGEILDVVVDIRKSSLTFGKWCGVYLNEFSGNCLWIPPGFAHGFMSLRDNTTVYYKCTEYYMPKNERTIIWNDSYLKLPWLNCFTDGGEPLVSDKDKKGKTFTEAMSE